MKVIFLTLLLSLCIFATGYSQITHLQKRLSGSFGIGMTTGEARYTFSASFNFQGKYEMPISASPCSLIASTGLMLYPLHRVNAYNDEDLTQVFIPVQTGIRYYTQGVFVELAAGASFKVNNFSPATTSVAPLVSPGMGYGFRFGPTQRGGLDLAVHYNARLERYNGVGFNQIAVSIAFSLGVK